MFYEFFCTLLYVIFSVNIMMNYVYSVVSMAGHALTFQVCNNQLTVMVTLDKGTRIYL